jgi:sulfur carrier protein ThiS
MPVRVKLYNLLAERSLSGRDEYEVPFEDGLRPVDLIHREGFFGEEEQAIVVLVNDEQSIRDAALSDGDRVELMINMVGGATGAAFSISR